MTDPSAVAAAVTPRTAAIMPVQLNGRTCDMAALQAIADRHGLAIIEDAAQALGSKFKGRTPHPRHGREFSFIGEGSRIFGAAGPTTNDEAMWRGRWNFSATTDARMD